MDRRIPTIGSTVGGAVVWVGRGEGGVRVGCGGVGVRAPGRSSLFGEATAVGLRVAVGPTAGVDGDGAGIVVSAAGASGNKTFGGGVFAVDAMQLAATAAGTRSTAERTPTRWAVLRRA